MDNNQTMASMMDEIEKSMKVLRNGDIVEGTVIAVTDSEVIVNVGSASDGIIEVEELSDETPLCKLPKD